MGIAGTEVAKEASDIILMDDNFASLVKAVVWGRCVYDAIRKFLQFQLTVNVSAVVITFVTAFYTTVTGDKIPEGILTSVQLLWVNLIMDTLAALALASDAPSDELLKRKPSRRVESIISADMYRMIFAQATYQVIVCLVIYFKGYEWFGQFIPAGESQHSDSGVDPVTATIVFNTFIFCQIFNEINARSITRGILV
jgi:P-type Ca2+ transporter type 2C